jgi:hypothetical protein
MSLLLSGHPEIVTRILQNCDDFPQLLSIIGACKRLYSVWEANSGIIAWGVGQRSIVAFDDALMAVRIILFSSILSVCAFLFFSRSTTGYQT